MKRAWRAAILCADGDSSLRRLDDAVLVVEQGRVIDLDEPSSVARRHPGLAWEDWRPWVIAPGFVDLHLHFPQLDVIGSPADGLLDWLDRHTFPNEARFADPAHAAALAEPFLDELLRHGVTTAMVFGSSHPASVEALFSAASSRGMRLIAGKCLMDRHCPEAVRDDTEGGLADSRRLIERWHGRGRLGYALTPRFAPSCTEAQMRGAARLAEAYPDTWIQTHLAENADEIAWVASLFPEARSYLDVYERCGLLRPRAVFAHGIHLDAHDRARLAQAGAAIAVCPTSNLFLGSGLFDFDAARQAGVAWGLASDVGGGSSFSPFRTMLAAHEVARLRGATLSARTLWRHHTVEAARAIGLGGVVGDLVPGADADFIAIDPLATPLLARRVAAARTLDEWLFALIVLGDDRAIVRRVVAGSPCSVPG